MISWQLGAVADVLLNDTVRVVGESAESERFQFLARRMVIDSEHGTFSEQRTRIATLYISAGGERFSHEKKQSTSPAV